MSEAEQMAVSKGGLEMSGKCVMGQRQTDIARRFHSPPNWQE